jgi:hypothetical protein
MVASMKIMSVFVRCLGLHYNLKLQDKTKKNVLVYYEQWCEYINTDLSPDDFSGKELNEMPKVEKCFKININIFERQQDGAVEPTYKSAYKFKSNIYLNVHGHHVSYENNFKAYSKKYQCPTCHDTSII